MKVERNGKEFELTKDELFLAHKEYVTSSMQHVLENDFKIPAKYSALIAKEAFHGADYELRAEEARKNLNQDLNLIDYKYEAAKDAPVQNVSQAKRPLKRPRKTMSKI